LARESPVPDRTIGGIGVLKGVGSPTLCPRWRDPNLIHTIGISNSNYASGGCLTWIGGQQGKDDVSVIFSFHKDSETSANVDSTTVAPSGRNEKGKVAPLGFPSSTANLRVYNDCMTCAVERCTKSIEINHWPMTRAPANRLMGLAAKVEQIQELTWLRIAVRANPSHGFRPEFQTITGPWSPSSQ
jgi:hypothetical protein